METLDSMTLERERVVYISFYTPSDAAKVYYISPTETVSSLQKFVIRLCERCCCCCKGKKKPPQLVEPLLSNPEEVSAITDIATIRFLEDMEEWNRAYHAELKQTVTIDFNEQQQQQQQLSPPPDRETHFLLSVLLWVLAFPITHFCNIMIYLASWIFFINNWIATWVTRIPEDPAARYSHVEFCMDEYTYFIQWGKEFTKTKGKLLSPNKYSTYRLVLDPEDKANVRFIMNGAVNHRYGFNYVGSIVNFLLPRFLKRFIENWILELWRK